MKRALSLFSAAAAFAALILFSAAAKEGAAWGAQLFWQLLLPSLLPFFVLTNLLNALGLPEVLGRRLEGLMGRLFSLPGCAAPAVILGLCGGYPLGAATAAGLCRSGKLTREEGERLLLFCDNTGPAFAVAAMGAGALGSSTAGVLLWLCHALSAMALGILFRSGECGPERRETFSSRPAESPPALGEALTGAVGAAGSAILNVGFFVVFFSALLYVLDAMGVIGALSRLFSEHSPLGDAECRCLVWSFFELSGSVGLLSALPLCPLTLALASFALSWGGLCVHCQSAAVTAPAGLSSGRRLRGKLLHGLLAGALAYIMSTLLFLFSPAFLS